MVNGLDGYLKHHKLIQKAPLSALKDTRLGIDLEVYLRGVLSNPTTAEPVVAALGGSPLALISHIENDLRSLERARIKPVFVLSGLPPAPSPTSNPSQKNRSQPHPHSHPRPPPASSTAVAHKFFSEEEWKMNERSKAWDYYSQADQDSMSAAFARSNSLEILDLVRNVLRALRHRNVEYLVAPYMASGQLVSLERHVKAYVHSMYGKDDLFMFDRVDKVILSLTLSKDNPADSFFTFASKSAIMNELRCNEEEFLDMSLLAGFEFCPPLPGLLDGVLTAPVQVQPGVPPAVDITRAMGLVKQYRSGFTVCVALENHHPAMAQSGYVDLFCRARCMIKYCLVISAEEGKVMPLPLATPPPANVLGPSNGIGANGPAPGGIGSSAGTGGPSIPTAADVPVDLQDIFSLRLPDEVFLHLSRGLVGASALRWLTSGVILEPPPFDKGETEEYRKFVKDNLTELHASPRCLALALLRSALHTSWQSRKVSVVYWFAPQVEAQVPVGANATQSCIDRIDFWNVPVSFVEEELRRQHSSTIDIALCIGATMNDAQAARTVTPKQTPNPNPKVVKGVTQPSAAAFVLDKKDEVVANVIWRMLELRGFLSHAHLHTAWARALYLAVKDARLNDKLQEPLFLALELLRAQVLHWNWFSKIKYEGGPALGEEPDQKKLLLVMRCFSLIPMTYKPVAWDAKVAPLSKELLVFNSFSKSLGRSMRILVEMIASNMLLRGDARRARDDYLDIALSLPFRHDADTGLGILVKCYIEGVISCKEGEPITPDTKWDEPSLLEAKRLVLSALEDTFKNVKDVAAELKRGFRFWAALMQAVEVVKNEPPVTAELVQQFHDSDAWLRPMAEF